jgi:indolepyruvate ferredoxin oxidoreductase alpha subunit
LNKLSNPQAGKKMVLMGNEAIARGAIEAGVKVVAAYPGTPSSEIVEVLLECSKDLGFYAEWSVNEKISFEVSTGASLMGVRALTALKGAGLNVIMDMLMTIPYTGIRGGFLLVVADDPGAHYSSNEQDSRMAAQWANLLCLEPENHQEAKEMAKAAFEISERLEMPVILRSATRLSHCSGVVEMGALNPSEMVPGFNKHYKLPYRWNVYGPPGTESKHAWQLAQLPAMRNEAESSPFTQIREGKSPVAVISCGLGSAYSREAVRILRKEDDLWFVKVGTPYPIPSEKLLPVLKSCKKVLVVEDGDPLMEAQLRVLAQQHGLPVQFFGKVGDGVFALHGELNTDKAVSALAKILDITLSVDLQREAAKQEANSVVVPRSSTLCAGCPHLGTYWAMKRALKPGVENVPVINGDIGCYEQAGYGVKGQMPEASADPAKRYLSRLPYDFLDTLHIMGSGISLAQGEAHSGVTNGQFWAVAGDSTFYHSCMPSLVNAVWNNANITFVVMDNYWTSMTGHQVCPATGLNPRNQETKIIPIENIVQSIGVEQIEVVDPYDISATIAAMKKASAFEGPSVVVARRECALQVLRRSGKGSTRTVITDACTGCTICVQLGCPATTFDNNKAGIDPLLCVNCGMCKQLCPENAIVEEVVQ